MISARSPPSLICTHPYAPQPLPPRCDNYLVVMDKVEVLAVEVVRPGQRSRGDRSKDRVPVPPSISPSSFSLSFFNTKQLKVTSNKVHLYWTKFNVTITKEHVPIYN